VQVNLVPDVEKGEVLLDSRGRKFSEDAVRMARGKPGMDGENRLLLELAGRGMNPQQIYDSGRLPERTYEAINKQLERCRFVATRRKTFVETIEQSVDALGMEKVVKLFSTAFEQIYGLSVVEQNFCCKFI
jgi:hypothetical protein